MRLEIGFLALAMTLALGTLGSGCIGPATAGSDQLLASTGDDSAPGRRCGGNVMNPPQCAAGFSCLPDPADPLPPGDVGGVCVPLRCGGNAINPPKCPSGYDCSPDPTRPGPAGDVGGVCVPVHCGDSGSAPVCPSGYDCVAGACRAH